MQGDAFPTPPIYSLNFQPQLIKSLLEHEQEQQNLELKPNYLLNEIEQLISDCSTEESKTFWSATNRIKIKHEVMESMQKIESLFLDLARESTHDPDLIAAVSENLLYKNTAVIEQTHLKNGHRA